MWSALALSNQVVQHTHAGMRRAVFIVLLATTLVINIAILAGVRGGNPVRYFEEKTLTTFFCALMLLAIAWCCYQMKQHRHVAPDRTLWQPETAIWGLMAFGFAYLAADEVAQIHESVDKLIHRVFHIKETSLTDHLDDVIVGLYGIVGIAALIAYRKELARHRHVLPFLVTGGILFFFMVGFDYLTNGPEILGRIFKRNFTDGLMAAFKVAEEAFKLYASACFLLAFYSAVYKIKAAASSSPSHVSQLEHREIARK